MSQPLVAFLLGRSLTCRLARLQIRTTAIQSIESVQEVCTTGYSFITPLGRVSKYGIYWGPDDPRNVIREVPGITHIAAMLMAMIDAVRIAQETVKDKKLLLYTDYNCPSNFRSTLKLYADRDFYSFHGSKMKNAELLEELYKLARETDVIFKYRPAVENKKPNYVIENILRGEQFRSWDSFAS